MERGEGEGGVGVVVGVVVDDDVDCDVGFDVDFDDFDPNFADFADFDPNFADFDPNFDPLKSVSDHRLRYPTPPTPPKSRLLSYLCATRPSPPMSSSYCQLKPDREGMVKKGFNSTPFTGSCAYDSKWRSLRPAILRSR